MTTRRKAEKELFSACEVGDFGRVGRAIVAGVIDPKKVINKDRNFKGETPLHTACRCGCLELVKHLVVVQGCSTECTNGFWKRTPLHYACLFGHVEVVKYLIETQGCSTGCTTVTGRTPLHDACWNGHLEVVKYLIEEVQGCFAGCTDDYGQTPLHDACFNRKLEVVKYLIGAQGCSAGCIDNRGQTPLHVACEIRWYSKETTTAIIACLLERGNCDPNCATLGGQTPLDIARWPEHIRLLLKFGAIPNESNMHKCFPENQPGSTPTMPELLNFKAGDRNIIIPREIGSKYLNFGVLLLQERTLAHIYALEHQYQRNCEAINCHILHEWLEGRGRKPTTWATLARVLYDIEKGELAAKLGEFSSNQS